MRAADLASAGASDAAAAGAVAAAPAAGSAPDAAAASAGGSAPASRFRLDALAVPLARGERPATWGLNLNAFRMGRGAGGFRDAYEAWAARARELLAGTGAYVYPYDFVHVTVASPAPFTHAPLASWSAEERAAYAAAVAGALRSVAAADARWPVAPFDLVPARLELHASCGVLMFDDPAGGVEALRRCVDAARADARLAPGTRAGGLRARSGDKQPASGFVHSTVMRLARERAPGVTDEDVAAAWARAAAAWPWGGARARCDELVLVEEVVAYQHMDGEASVVETYAYAPPPPAAAR